MMPKRSPTAISLYTGAGGLDFGFEAAGVQVLAAVENDPDCCATLRRNRNWRILCGDIELIPTCEILQAGSLRPKEVDLVIGGPPCQPFSKSGYWVSGDAKRLSDPRASTISAFLRVVREALPRAFLIENVEGLGYRSKNEGLMLVLRTVEEINHAYGTKYCTATAVMNAADYGVPQTRRRLIIIASRDGRVFKFPEPTHVDPRQRGPGDTRPSYATAWDVVHDLPSHPNEPLQMKGRWAELLPSIPEGHNYLWHTDRMGGLPLFGWRRRYWSFLLKLAKDRPAWTLQAQPGPATGPFHWSNRRLSVREMCRLQTIPDDVEIVGTYSAAQRQLGNAVPSLLMELLAREMSRQLLDIEVSAGPLRLAARRAPSPPPGPEEVMDVPSKYLALQGRHIAHPGTGLGTRALRRLSEETANLVAQ